MTPLSFITDIFNDIWSRFTKTTPRHVVVTFLHGLSMGTAEIIPGVSSSTIAVLYGIYDDFLLLLHGASEVGKGVALALLGKESWKTVKTRILEINWPFGVILGVGMITAVILFSSGIELVLRTSPSYLFAFLFGLIPPTIYIVHDEIEEGSRYGEAVMTVTVISLLLVFYALQGALQVPDPHPLYVLFAGTIAISAMVLPGISGSFMLLMLGIYNSTISVVSRVTSLAPEPGDLAHLGALVVGVFVGFITSVRLLRWAFEKHRDTVLFFILGLLIASWYVLWPFVIVQGFSHGEPLLAKVAPWDLPLLQSLSLILIVIGTSIGTYAAHRWADRHDPTSPKLDHGMDEL